MDGYKGEESTLENCYHGAFSTKWICLLACTDISECLWTDLVQSDDAQENLTRTSEGMWVAEEWIRCLWVKENPPLCVCACKISLGASLEVQQSPFSTSCTWVSQLSGCKTALLHSNMFFSFLVYNAADTRSFYCGGKTMKELLTLVAFLSHHVFHCLLLIHMLKIKECISQLNHRCFFFFLFFKFNYAFLFHSKGLNRWKLGSSVSSKLDKQTEFFWSQASSKMLFIRYEKNTLWI